MQSYLYDEIFLIIIYKQIIQCLFIVASQPETKKVITTTSFITYYQQSQFDLQNFIESNMQKKARFTKQSENRKRYQEKWRKGKQYLEPKYADLLQHFLTSFEPLYEDEDSQSLDPTVKNSQNNQLHRTFSLLDREMHQLTQGADKVIGNFSKQKSQKKLSKIQEVVPRPSKRKKSKKVAIKSYVDLWQVKHEKMPELPSLQPIQHSITKNHFRQPSEQKYVESDLARRAPSKLLSQRKVDKEVSPANRTIYRPHQAFRTNTFFRRDKFQ